MNRRLFLNRLARWTIMIIIAGLTFLLRKKFVSARDCSSCPDYASCTDPGNCSFQPAKS